MLQDMAAIDPKALPTGVRAMIVDDEAHGRRVLRTLLGALEGIEVVAEAAGAAEARQLIGQHRPDLVFMDIEMPGANGIEVMRRRRGIDDIYRLTSGPGRLTQAFGIDLRLDGAPYAAGNALWFADDGFGAARIGSSVRIGITRNADKPWRYYMRGNRWVSGPAKLNAGK